MENKKIHKITKEFIQFNWNKTTEPLEKIFKEFDTFYGLKGKQELDKNMIDGGITMAVDFLAQEYNRIPFAKRSFQIV